MAPSMPLATPVLDTNTNTLRFERFNFTVETKNVLIKTANWMVHDDILSRLEPETRIDLWNKSVHCGASFPAR